MMRLINIPLHYRQMQKKMLLCASWSFVLFTTTIVPICEVTGQEYPNSLYKVPQFHNDSSINFRQNVCGRHHRYQIGEIPSIELALEGLELRAILRDSPYFILDDDGKIDSDYPGISAILLDEVARRGKFTWRNSFQTFTATDMPEGKTWTDLLLWSADTYDISAADWDNTLERVKSGIAFPGGWYDSSLILVGKINAESEEVFNPWSWLAPFDYAVWLLILATIITSGLVYMFLDFVDPYSDKRKLKSHPIESMYLSAMGFAGHMEFEPQTHPARLFTFSLAMWALLMAAAYTANLASFLVVRNVPTTPIDSVEDAVRLGAPICVWKGTGSVGVLKKDFPNVQMVEKDLEEDTFKGVLNGDCNVALAYTSSWFGYERDANVNGECGLQWVGRKYKNMPSGFGTSMDIGTLCTSLIRDVINIHMLEMRDDGFIDQAWQEHLHRTATIDCSATTSSEDNASSRRRGLLGGGGGKSSTLSSLPSSKRRLKGGGGAAAAAAASGGAANLDAQRMNVKNMGGIFLMHGGLSCIAILLALIHRVVGLQARRDEERRKKNLRRHLKRSDASKTLRSTKDPKEKRTKLMQAMADFGSDDGDRFFEAADLSNEDDVNDSDNSDDDDFWPPPRRTTSVREQKDDDSWPPHRRTTSVQELKGDDIDAIKTSVNRLEEQMSRLTAMIETSSKISSSSTTSTIRMDGSIESTRDL